MIICAIVLLTAFIFSSTSVTAAPVAVAAAIVVNREAAPEPEANWAGRPVAIRTSLPMAEVYKREAPDAAWPIKPLIDRDAEPALFGLQGLIGRDPEPEPIWGGASAEGST
ncbi:hypothetical protein V1509DRAFT_563366 [Lipomyces kononenkoae]